MSLSGKRHRRHLSLVSAVDRVRQNHRAPFDRRGHLAMSYVAPLPSAADFYSRTIQDFKEYPNGWAWGRCPFHADHHPSLSVNLRTGSYKCHSSSCGETGPSIVSFFSALHGLSRDEAIARLREWLWT